MFLKFAETHPSLHDASDPHGSTVGHDINETLTAMLPWGVSLIFHGGLVLLGLFVVWSTVIAPPETKPVIIPVLALSESPQVSLNNQPQHLSAVKSTSKHKIPIAAPKHQEARKGQLTATSTKLTNATSIIGIAGNGGIKGSPFSNGLAEVGGSSVTFAGNTSGGGNVHKVVFVIDASGSLLDTFPYVIKELDKSISGLSDKQQFTVIFFQGNIDDGSGGSFTTSASTGRIVEVNPPGWKRATAENKRRVIEWISPQAHNIHPQGMTDPIPALKRALHYRPDLIFLLSDNITGHGKYEKNQEDLLAEIKRANVGGTKINTIQFIHRDPLVHAGLEPTLKQISVQSGSPHGYTFVSAESLGLE